MGSLRVEGLSRAQAGGAGKLCFGGVCAAKQNIFYQGVVVKYSEIMIDWLVGVGRRKLRGC